MKDPRGSRGSNILYYFKDNWASDEGEPRDWIKEIQDKMNYLRMKGIDIDEVFSVLMKIMKKVKLEVGLTNIDLN